MMPGATVKARTPSGLVAAIECQGEQRVGGFRLTVGVPAIVGLVLKIRIREVDVVKPMGPGTQHDQSRRRPCPQKRREPVDQDEVAEMVGAELHLESVEVRAESIAITPAFATIPSSPS